MENKLKTIIIVHLYINLLQKREKKEEISNNFSSFKLIDIHNEIK